MGMPQARLGELSTGHWIGSFWFPEVPLTSASPDTFSSFIPVCRVSDTALRHVGYLGGVVPIPGVYHDPVALTGSPSCFINGLSAFRIGDMYNCGDIQAMGNPTHLVC